MSFLAEAFDFLTGFLGYPKDQENIIVKITRDEEDLQCSDILRERKNSMTQDSLTIFFIESKASDLIEKNTYRKGFRLNQENTSERKVGASSTEILQELYSNLTETDAINLGCTMLSSALASTLMRLLLMNCLLQLLNHI